MINSPSSMLRRSRAILAAASGLIALLLPSPSRAFDTVVVLNEIHYHPAGADDPPLEFVELHNQQTVHLDLTGWRLSGGIDYEFPRGTIIRGGGYLVVAADPERLKASTGANGVLGPYTGMLDNGGETIRLRNNNDRIMDEVRYNDRGAWPVGADGSGASLAKLDPRTKGDEPSHWAAGTDLGGSPGARNRFPEELALKINEVGGSDNASDNFFVELLNPAAAAVMLDGFRLVTESGATAVLDGLMAPASGILEITEARLEFRPADGENLYLYSPDDQFLDAVRVDDDGRARIPDGTGPFFVTAGQVAPTPGTPNPAAPTSPVVINEIMYHHRPVYPDPGPPAIAYAEDDEEWIELHNPSNQPVALEGWGFDGAIGFTFPEGTTIAAGDYLVVARNLEAFTARHPGVTAMGGFSGSLSNRGEEVLLVDMHGNPVERVHYRDDLPWPPEADGEGSSLELRNPALDRSSPDAWRASSNAATAEWHDYEFTMRALNPVYTPNIRNFHELRIGLLGSGQVLLDKFSVIEDPGGANLELIPNGEFNNLAGWRRTGTHRDTRPIREDGESVLRLTASGRMNYLNNLLEASLFNGTQRRPVRAGTNYRVSFRAKWLSGSPQFRFELYYNKLARTVILKQPDRHGTPGARNSTYQETTGPVFKDLRHTPAVPRPNQPVEVSVVAQDPDGLGEMTLRYAANGGSTITVPMTYDADTGRWKGILPGHPQGTVLQFYVEGNDASPSPLRSYAPPGGPRSHALVRFDSSRAHGAKRSIRINLKPNDANALHNSNDILSNYRTGCTIITDENRIAYDCGIRLRGSMWSRRQPDQTGLNIKFPADRLYRGVHSTITTRRGNRREILVKHIINASGGLHDNYNDILYQYGHRPGQTGPVRAELARFGSPYLQGLPGGRGTDGTVFKMEGIREFQATQDGSPDSPKLPFPIGWIPSFDLADQGTDKEIYRHNMRINSNFEKDDYESIIRMCRTFSLNGRDLEDEARAAIDVDQWTRQFALLSLCGIGDTYSQGNPHNLNFYVRPRDGVVESMPWDWDFTFNRSVSSPLWGNRNVSKIFARPVYSRLFYGHLHDLIRNSFNSRYLTFWFRHYETCSGESYSGNLSYITNRANYVLSRLPARIPFSITTNSGADFSTADPTVELSGRGWIDVREVFLNDAPEPVAVTWIDGDSWRLSAPLNPGENVLSFTAIDHRGNEVGTDSITVTNTGVIEPASAANLAISELLYDPLESEAEFLELLNTSPSSIVDLGGAAFVEGVRFTFPLDTRLAPGERLLLVRNQQAFEALHGTTLPVAGEFEEETRLADGGERLRLESLGGETIHDFTYNDRAPWPRIPAGSGHSIVLVAPESGPDHAVASNWRASVSPGGSPAGTDAITFEGDPLADENGDGLSDFMNYAFGTSARGPTVRHSSTGLTVSYSRNLAADDVIWAVEFSDDLQSWSHGEVVLELASESLPADGVTTVVLRQAATQDPPGLPRFVRLRVERR